MISAADLKSPTNLKTNEGLFNFVIECNDSELEGFLSLTPNDRVEVFSRGRGDLCWCLQTYYLLAQHGKLSVQCSNHLQEGCINIVHSSQLLKVKGSAQEFIVCVQADYPHRPWAQYHIVQNGNRRTANASYIPHWVQPGLIRRNPNRKGVTRVAYAGAPIKGNLAGPENSWQNLLRPHGIEFVLLTSGFWHDLSAVDVLVGIRSFSKKSYDLKPASKLFNAWHAQIPFIGGYDSAYREVGAPGEDYLMVTTPEEFVTAVLRLRDEPELYARLVRQGEEKARLYTQQAITEIWEKTLSQAIIGRYEQWKRRPGLEHLRFSMMYDLGLFEHNTKQLVKRALKAF
ncbi:glycosyltransferase [Cesiribacter sp. SM1]|uniref:glycosyltransferase n=1 Tax=Cesiribacter sp. SM1 TaxID=2861196 RepID=UPI001CD2E7DB|nr:glycosyltransferase [Cesiribacter sp. SM1]